MSIYHNEFRKDTSKFEVTYGFDEYTLHQVRYILYFDTRSETAAAVRELLTEFNYVKIVKLN